MRDQLVQAGLLNPKLNDGVQLNSVRAASPPAEPLPTPHIEPPKPKSPWSLNTPLPTLDTNSVSPVLSTPRPLSGEVSPLNESTPHFIPREIVSNRLSANDDFLQRRRQSRVFWQDKLRQSSISSISENQISGSSPIISPVLGSSMAPTSPLDTSSRLTGSAAMARDRSQTSQGTRSSRTSSILHDIPERPRHDSTNSQESIFGLRTSDSLSPPLSEHYASGPEWGALATTLRVPGYGNGVEDGLEVVRPIDHDNGLILANEIQVVIQPTPTSSVNSIDHPMRHDASFYKYGGFCDGSKMILRGEACFKIVKRPSVCIADD